MDILSLIAVNSLNGGCSSTTISNDTIRSALSAGISDDGILLIDSLENENWQVTGDIYALEKEVTLPNIGDEVFLYFNNSCYAFGAWEQNDTTYTATMYAVNYAGAPSIGLISTTSNGIQFVFFNPGFVPTEVTNLNLYRDCTVSPINSAFAGAKYSNNAVSYKVYPRADATGVYVTLEEQAGNYAQVSIQGGAAKFRMYSPDGASGTVAPAYVDLNVDGFDYVDNTTHYQATWKEIYNLIHPTT